LITKNEIYSRPATRSCNGTALARDKTDHSVGRNHRVGDDMAVIVQVIGAKQVRFYYILVNSCVHCHM